MGKSVGRNKVVSDEDIAELARAGKKAKEIAELLGVSVDSVYHAAGWRNRGK